VAVFGVPVTVHNPMETRTARNPGFFSLLLDWPFRWAAYQLRQIQVGALGAAPAMDDDTNEPNDPVYHARAFARHNELLIRLRRFGVPVINEEPGYEMQGAHPWNSQSSLTVRQTFWTATVAGAYTMWGNAATYEGNDPLPDMKQSAVPGFLRTLADTIEALPYWEMEPMNEMVEPRPEPVQGVLYRTNFALGKPGSVYLVYSRQGGPLTVDLPPGRYAVSLRQLAPLASAVPGFFEHTAAIDASTATKSYSVELRPAYDWILVFRREGRQR